MSSVLLQPAEPDDAGVIAPDRSLYQHLVDIVSEGIYVVDRDRRITFWNAVAETITGYSAEAVLGRRCAEGILQHCNERGEILCGTRCPLVDTMSDGRERNVDAFFLHHAGRRVPVKIRSSAVRDESGDVVGCAELFTDSSPVNAMLEELRAEREHARIDPLTGVGNRRLIQETLAAFGGRRSTTGRPAGVIFFDIDHFKLVNDTYGHDVGDRAIVEVARTASGILRSFDTIGRWGGEEFVVIARGLDLSGAAVLAERLRAMVGAARIRLPFGDFGVTISIGVTLIEASESGESALMRADRLMYESKRGGRNRVTAG